MSLGTLTEMIGRESLVRLLRLCGAQACETADTASDYEVFRAFCRSAEYLSGHPLLARARAILKQCFSIDEPISPETCDAIWKSTADALLQAPISIDLDAVELNTETCIPQLREENRISLASAFPATLLARTRSGSFDAWMREIGSVLTDARARGCTRVFFGLPAPYTDRKPDIYHVDQVLHQARRQKPDLDLLYAQLMRTLAKHARELGMELILRVECGAEDAIALLDRVERDVGLPPLVWSAADADTRDALIEWSSKQHDRAVTAALIERDYPTADALDESVSVWATVYPVGRLQLLVE